jgi:hypothetical protein
MIEQHPNLSVEALDNICYTQMNYLHLLEVIDNADLFKDRLCGLVIRVPGC